MVESKYAILIRMKISLTETKVKTLEDNNPKITIMEQVNSKISKIRIFDQQTPLKEILKMDHLQKQLANPAIYN